MVKQQLSIVRGEHNPSLLKHEVLADLLEHTARQYPQHTALVFDGQQIDYQTLNQRADLIAHHLIEQGVRPGHIVGLWLPRGLDLLVAQAGIAKAGAAWLPFDMDVPVDRIAVCLDDASAVGMLTAPEWQAQLNQLTQPVWSDQQLLQPVEAPLQQQRASASDPAYVIYTSGSTGKPKGIVINQGSICHFLRSENAVLGVRHEDKVYQGFSVAFDMSFEEIWISYLVGATLWIAPKALVTDPEQLSKALQEQQISVLHAVPTLLALFPQDVPNLRIINLGGEMCPDALVERWALPHHQMFNTYGPTEATVSASLAQLHAGQPVTIGTPLPNYGLLVMSEDQQLLAQGETGELCIFGPGVALGYLGRPDLTAEKFIDNPWAETGDEKRLYRTGDLARLDEQGQIQCLGRADDQVKIRGFRVELGEIEAALCDQPGIGTAAVVLRQEDGMEQLIAFVVPDDVGSVHTVDMKTLRAALKARLPAYMIPNRIEVIAQVPRLLSGKIDRKALRVLPLTSVVDRAASDEPQNPAEQVLFAILAQLFPNQPIQLGADFFDDMGGHSLLAAVLISRLREHEQYSHLTIQHIYQARRVGRIAQLMLEQPARQQQSSHVFEQGNQQNSKHRLYCGIAQLLVIPLLISINILQWLAPFFTYHYLTGGPNDSIAHAILASLGVYVLSIIVSFSVSITAKRLLTSGLKAGSYPLWGLTYFRWWLADRLTDISPVYLLSGSTLNNLYLRCLGARIGHDVTIGSVHVRMPALLHIEDGVSIGSHVNLENAKIEHGQLVLGHIHLQQESYIGSYSVVEENCTLQPYAHLNAQSALTYGTSIPAHEIWDGAPAQKTGLFDAAQQSARPALGKGREYAEYVYYILSVLVISCIFFIPIFPSFIIVDWLDVVLFQTVGVPQTPVVTALYYFLLAIPASALMIMVTALISATVRKLILPDLQEGTYAVHGATYYRKWFATQILETSLATLRGLFATVYAPSWFRLLGAKVGKNAEISTATGVVPELLHLGDESFIADAVMLGDEEISGGWMTLKRTHIGHRSFVGNSAYIADGTHLPDGVLIGVQSKAPDNSAMKSGDTWFGSPSLRLPARETVTSFAEHLTFRPSLYRRLMRSVIEGLRIVLPLALAIGVGYMIVLEVIDVTVAYGWWAGFGMLALAGLLYGVGCFLIVTLMKWLLIGRYKPTSAPMWTMFVWLSEGITSLYEAVAVPNFLNYLRGTPLLPFFLRLLGVKIGKQVYMDTTDITEFDCVSIGDRAELNSFSGPQTHLFEDRVMKIGHVHIGCDVTINTRSIVLYNAEVGNYAVLGPLTLVMKGEKIPAKSAWIGSPSVPWDY